MTEPDRDQPADSIPPDQHGDPEAVASELFVHGLLETRYRDGAAVQQRRLDRAMRAIRTELPHPAATPERRVPWPVLVSAALLRRQRFLQSVLLQPKLALQKSSGHTRARIAVPIRDSS